MGAFEVITSQANLTLALGASRQSLAQLLREYRPHWLEWVHFFCRKGIFVLPSAAFVLAALEMGDDLQQTFMECPSSIGLVLNMWMQQDEHGRHYLSEEIDSTFPLTCPLLSLLSLVVGDPAGSLTLRDQLREDPLEIQCIAQTMQRRTHALRKLLHTSVLSPTFVIRHLHELSAVVQALSYRPEYPFEFFHSHRLLSQVSLTLNVALRVEARTSIWLEALGILKHLYTWILKSKLCTGSPLKKVISAVRGGIIRVLLKALLHVPTSFHDYAFAANFLHDITGYVAYRSVAPWLVVMIDTEYSAMVDVCSPSPLFEQCRNEVLCAIQTNDDRRGPMIAQEMCDCVEHRGSNGGGEEGKSKRCGGCNTMAYCSDACQKTDWDLRHRQECDTLRELQLDVPILGLELHLRARANLAAFVEGTSLILRVNAVAAPCLGSLSTVVQFLESIKSSFGEDVPQRQRINDYVTQMLQVRQIRLAYALFPLGLSTVHLLVRMWEDGSSTLRVVGFMTVGISECQSVNEDRLWSSRGLRGSFF
ncbi:hypothetical protein FA13DRAFT_1797246 [Coprinellus micaceus]|uniref:MYND-type domain-containing protein n=1 Tax=Coprinellus micaceus TaxID=71717 RepID=A0A4Y7SR68_COPMI|nr:hypothetical protein FA13DRAFT_1797246 [Coprinellus micaceus]